MNDPQEKPEEAQNDEAPEAAPETPSPEQQVAALKDQLLRALAEAENTRRRAQKEREDTAKYAIANFAKDMLAVADNFQRALEAIPEDARADKNIENLVTGIEATERQLTAALERFGVKKLDPLGKLFDPNFHRVMTEVDDPDQPPGTVVQVLQPGYVIHDRLLREALVAVAKSPAASGGHKVDTSA